MIQFDEYFFQMGWQKTTTRYVSSRGPYIGLFSSLIYPKQSLEEVQSPQKNYMSHRQN